MKCPTPWRFVSFFCSSFDLSYDRIGIGCKITGKSRVSRLWNWESKLPERLQNHKIVRSESRLESFSERNLSGVEGERGRFQHRGEGSQPQDDEACSHPGPADFCFYHTEKNRILQTNRMTCALGGKSHATKSGAFYALGIFTVTSINADVLALLSDAGVRVIVPDRTKRKKENNLSVDAHTELRTSHHEMTFNYCEKIFVCDNKRKRQVRKL